jgi:hypothetical protein
MRYHEVSSGLFKEDFGMSCETTPFCSVHQDKATKNNNTANTSSAE